MCSHTAYIQVEGIRGKVSHYSGTNVFVGFLFVFLNAHHTIVYITG